MRRLSHLKPKPIRCRSAICPSIIAFARCWKKNFSNKIEGDVSVVVFLDLGVTDDDVANFKNQLFIYKGKLY